MPVSKERKREYEKEYYAKNKDRINENRKVWIKKTYLERKLSYGLGISIPEARKIIEQEKLRDQGSLSDSGASDSEPALGKRA